MELKIEKRQGAKTKALRGEEMMPAVFYGPKEDSTAIKVFRPDFLKVWQRAGETTIIKLKDGKTEKDALIHDIQLHPVTGLPLHADFYVIEEGKKLQVPVPIKFEGEAPAEKQGLVLVKVLHEIEIEALPDDLIHEVKVDLTGVEELEDQILIKDLNLPAGVETILDEGEVVVAVSEPKEEPEPEEEEDDEIDMESIEVEGEVPEGEEGAPAEGEEEGAEEGGAPQEGGEGKEKQN